MEGHKGGATSPLSYEDAEQTVVGNECRIATIEDCEHSLNIGWTRNFLSFQGKACL